jgi:hypothetical protein
MRAAMLLVALVMFALPAAAEQRDGPAGPNLVRNPSFEQVENGRIVGWEGPGDVFTSDAGAASDGARSLKFVNADAGRYVLFTQTIPLEPGRIYEVLAKVRTQGVAGDDSGATVCVEWSDAHGGYLGGVYPEGRKGDTPEWTEVSGLTGRIPAAAARMTVTCYLRKGMTGTAWWDEVSVRRWRQRPLETLLLSPSYRGLVFADGPRRAEVRVRVLPHELDRGLGAVRLHLSLADPAAGSVVSQQTFPRVVEQQVLTMPIPAQGAPQYTLAVALTDAAGTVLARDAYTLRRSAPPASYIDDHNRLIVNGKPFFPLGMYFGGVGEEELREYAAAGVFNCLMPYDSPDPAQMDLLDSLGLKVIYSIKDYYAGTEWCPDFITSEADEEPAVRRTVRQFRDHPALLAWYLNDERPLSMLPRLEAHQRWAGEEDPNHPAWVVLFQVDDIARYTKSFDVIGADPYPIPRSDPSMAAAWTRLAKGAVGGRRGLWMVPQVFRWPEADRPPSKDELRSMTWQCITEGATGLIFYSWFELRGDTKFPFASRWPEVVEVAREVKDMAPVLLSTEPTPKVEVTGPGALHWTARTYQGVAYVILVNDCRDPVGAAIHLPAAHRVTLRGQAVPVGSDGLLKAHLAPLAVDIYRVEK